MNTSPNIRLEATLVFFISLLFFTTGYFNHEFVGFESRFALFAQEMLRNGLSFFPTTYHAPYPDYLATHTILIYWTALLIGKLNVLSAILPSAVACALTVMLTYLIGESQQRLWGFYAVLFELFTYGFLISARTISMDAFTMFAATFCFWRVCRPPSQSGFAEGGLIALGLCLGFVFRGPIGLVIPAAVVGAFYLVEKKFKQMFAMALLSAVLLGIGMWGLLKAAQYQGGPAFVQDVIHMQIVGRLANPIHLKPFYYYPLNGLSHYALSFPIAILVLLVYAREFFRTPLSPALKFLRHCALWLTVLMIGLSIPSAKKMRYLLPIVPAISLMAAYVWMGDPDNRWLKKARLFLRSFCYGLPGLCLLASIGCQIYAHTKSKFPEIHFIAADVLLGSLILFQIFSLPKVLDKKRQNLILFGSGVATFIVFLMFLVQPINVSLHRVTPFAASIEKLRQADQKMVFYKIAADGNAIKFMLTLDETIQPLFFENPEDILNLNQSAFFITTGQQFTEIPIEVAQKVEILCRGEIGHRKYVVFAAKKH